VVYKYEEDRLENGRFRAGRITISQNSIDRIKAPNTPLTIEAKGLRNNAATQNFVARQSVRFLDRFQFAAESIKVAVNYKTGFPIEVGDIVVFGNDTLKVTDIGQGNRNFRPRLMECVNKSLSINTGEVQLDLLDTAVGLNGRFCVVSPTSLIGPDATSTRIPIKRSYNTGEFEREQDKWTPYVREFVEIHNIDYSQSAIVRLLQVDPTTPNVLIVEALPFTPTEDMRVDMPKYPETDTDPDTYRKWKDIHGFTGLEVPIVSGISNTQFEIPAPNVDDFFVDAVIRVHTPDFAQDSTPTIDTPDATIVDITGNIITANRDLGFTPNSDFVCILIGFRDKGFPYRYI
jgi:hypothetical protein